MAELISLITVAALLPVLINDFRLLPSDWRGSLNLLSALMLLASIAPLCAGLGYLTPSLVDQYADGDPARAGKALCRQCPGCILGPLFACYLLLPSISERHGLVLLSLPFFAVWVCSPNRCREGRVGLGVWAAAVTLVLCVVGSQDFAGTVARKGKPMEVRRDHAAFVVSVGEGQMRELLVNGVGMTVLSPVTKYMVHLPLALQKEKPTSVLIICFGMGTTHRSALSWDIDTTSVELVPSVRDAFGFYHADAKEMLCHPKGRIIIDDGRRFLKRSTEQFDAIVIDPPPPVVAAGSSLLYSVEFYKLARQHLKPNGILQTWVPHPELWRAPPVLRSVCDSFPHVRCFRGVETLGYHILASMKPIELPPETELLARIPPAAKRDLLEWSASGNLGADLQTVLSHEITLARLLDPNRDVRITDDRPYNEYFVLRENVGGSRFRLP
jgi:spermidine synthase